MGRAHEVRAASMAKTAAIKSKQNAKFAKAIYVAAKSGLPDPDVNQALKKEIDKAKREHIPADVIKRAIEKAKGGQGEAYNFVRYEGFGPGDTMVIVDCLTDNVNRTYTSVKVGFSHCGFKLGVNGCVAYNFDNHPIDIIYEDSEIIVINKERGVLVHSDGESSETLLNYVSYYLLNKGETLKPRCVHRIDLDTIGLVLFSKNIISYYHLFYQMNNQMIEKRYYAVVKGKVASGVVDAKIGKNRHINNKYLVTKSGKDAKTIYDLISYKDDKTLIDVKILTGRTHQIRVHMAYISHPILGDNIYGSGNKLQLENYYLGFINPSDNKYQIIKIDNKLDY